MNFLSQLAFNTLNICITEELDKNIYNTCLFMWFIVGIYIIYPIYQHDFTKFGLDSYHKLSTFFMCKYTIVVNVI